MTRLLPDTNVLVYETVEDSPHHTTAARIVDEAREIILLPIVLHEYIWVMVKKLGVDPWIVAEKIREYLSDRRVRYAPEPPSVLVSALRMLREMGLAPREVNDLIILAAARQYGAVLATFDEKLRRVAQRLGVRVVP